jgi:lipid-binding SYLF domain-containing protein
MAGTWLLRYWSEPQGLKAGAKMRNSRLESERCAVRQVYESEVVPSQATLQHEGA